jgi:hypothetical protein
VTSLFDSLYEELKNFWKKPHAPRSKRAFRCDCERPVFFLISQCLGCGAPLGYEPMLGELRTLQPGGRFHYQAVGPVDRETDAVYSAIESLLSQRK